MADNKKVALGCAIGCGALIIAGLVLGVGGYFLFQRGLEQAGEMLAQDMTERYAALQEDDELTEEQMSMLGRIVDQANVPDIGSGAAMMCAAVFEYIVSAPEEDVDERVTTAEEVLGRVEVNLDMGFMDAAKMLEEYPQLQVSANEIHRRISAGELQRSTGETDTTEGAGEEPAQSPQPSEGAPEDAPEQTPPEERNGAEPAAEEPAA